MEEREFVVSANMENTHLHEVTELTEEGPVVRIGSLLRWQALAIVAILDPPFKE